jgi:hypothetical protein|nr:MAG TPA_asm: Pre-mRNA-splicing factor spp42, Pre-mRNA-splicing factor, U2/U5/U6, Lariat, RNA BINDING [Caudoviricetes sp.]
MKRDKLESYLGKYVKIILFDGTAIKGTLHKTGEKAFENDPDLSIPKQRYFCTDKNGFISSRCLFKVSHIKTFALAKMTNFEKIKSMSIHDMTQFLFVHQFDKCGNCDYYKKQCNGYYFDDKSCTTGIKHWLESEVEE